METSIEDLLQVISKWNEHDLVGEEDQSRVKEIGKKLCSVGGMDGMQKAYYAAQEKNRCAALLNYLWDGIGDWRA